MKRRQYGDIRVSLGEIFQEPTRRHECAILEGHLRPDYAHLWISIAPAYAVPPVVDGMKVKVPSQRSYNISARPGLTQNEM